MDAFDTLILEIRTAAASRSKQPEWGGILQKIAKHPEGNVLSNLVQSYGRSPKMSAGDRWTIHLSGVAFPMRLIPAGTFWMGAGADDKTAYEDEKPQHEVTITRGFWMMETPVTQGQYLAVMGENPSDFKSVGLGAPVEQVSWFDAAAFANKLSVLEGASESFVGSGEEIDGVGNKGSDYVGCKGWRLPTEAEWEYACRAGTTTPRYGYLDQIAWYEENSDRTTHAVSKKQANSWGLHDMLGNVWEWCYDRYGKYSAQAAKDHVGAATGKLRMARGVAWDNHACNIRSAQRGLDSPSTESYNLGFRLVRHANAME